MASPYDEAVQAPSPLGVDLVVSHDVAVRSSRRARNSLLVLATMAAACGVSCAPASASQPVHVGVLAGPGAPGSGGVGALATHAGLQNPQGIAVDAASDVFIADTGNCRVDLIPSSSGRKFTIAMSAHHLYVIAGGSCRHT